MQLSYIVPLADQLCHSALTKQQTHAGDHHRTVASCNWIKNVGCCVISHKPAYLIGAARKGSTPHFLKKLGKRKTTTKKRISFPGKVICENIKCEWVALFLGFFLSFLFTAGTKGH